MAYNQDAGLDFRPFRPGDFNYRTPILVGGQTATPYRKGVADLAYNQLTLWGQIGHPLVLHAPHPGDATIVLTAATTDYDYAAYYLPIPSYVNAGASSGRRYLTVRVRGYVSTGTWTPKARTSATPNVSGSASGTTSAIVNIEVPIIEGPTEDYLILAVQGSSAGATFTFESVTAVLKPMTSAGLTAGSATYNQDAFHPIDSTVQAAADMPFTVDMARSLALANAEMYRCNVRQVVNFCCIANYGTLWTASGDTQAATGRPLVLDDESTGYRRHWQWLYFPRAGVDRLKVWVDGYVRGWASSGDNVTVVVSLQQMDGTLVCPEVNVSIAKANFFSSATWSSGASAWLSGITGEGPFVIDMRTKAFSASADVRIGAVSIFEDFD